MEKVLFYLAISFYFIEKEYHMDVRDRALLYYRLLEGDLAKVSRVDVGFC